MERLPWVCRKRTFHHAGKTYYINYGPTYTFDESYFPSAEKIKLLSKYGYRNLWPKPEWVGFVHENKPYKLEEVPLGLGAHEYYKMEKVFNPYLKRSFELKKLQTGSFIFTGYHGTVSSKIDSIASNNSNWRLAGTSRGVKHGRGVCFSPKVSFVEQFCRGTGKIVIKTDYLRLGSIIGCNGNLLPRHPSCDTAQSPNGNVYVKFEDNEFLP